MSEETAVAKPVSFEDRMKAMLRENIGNLMTDEELKKLVDKGMEELFFAKKRNPHYQSYNSSYGPEYLPSLMEGMLKELMTEQVKVAINQYIKDNAETITPLIEKVVQEGAGHAILSALAFKFENEMQGMKNNLINSLHR